MSNVLEEFYYHTFDLFSFGLVGNREIEAKIEEIKKYNRMLSAKLTDPEGKRLLANQIDAYETLLTRKGYYIFKKSISLGAKLNQELMEHRDIIDIDDIVRGSKANVSK